MPWRTVAVVAAAALTMTAGCSRASEQPSPPPPVFAPPSASPTATAAPNAPAPEQPAAFQLKITDVDAASVSNDLLFGAAPTRPPKPIRRAAAAAAGALERYLNAAFVNPKTRFTKAPLKFLLTREARQAIGRRDRAALGFGMPAINGGRTGNAEASAFVLHAGRDAMSVTLRYTARMRLVTGDGQVRPVRQSGSVLMVRVGKGWKAEMVDVELSTQ